jgi:S1-C subfamily serine protease
VARVRADRTRQARLWLADQAAVGQPERVGAPETVVAGTMPEEQGSGYSPPSEPTAGLGWPGDQGGSTQTEQPPFGGSSPPGFDAPSWPDDAQRPRGRRWRGLLSYLAVAAVAAAAGAGVTGFWLHASPTKTAHGRVGNNPAPFPNFPSFPGLGRSGTSGSGIHGAAQRAVVNAVAPGLVAISSNLGYQGSQAAATGMVISQDGLVLTNNHVIAGTTQLYATVFATGQRFRARWLGYDAASDVAVIQLMGAHGLRTVPLGNSAAVKAGDTVIAIGNAYGANRATPSAGTITGLNRTVRASDNGAATSEVLHGMLQTNAGIVQGDSGGPLASSAGKVIGMDTAAATATAAPAQSVGFAIPINTALQIAHQIIAGHGSAGVQIGSTGFMGVLVPADKASQATSPQQQRRLQLRQDESTGGFPVQPSAPVCLANDLNAGVPARVAPAKSGALIIGELCGTPANKAGIVAGDVITAVGGHAVSSPAQLTGIMRGYRPGASVQVTWVDVRGQTHRSTLALIQAPPR